MKKKITLLFVFVATLLSAQQKSTGVVTLGVDMTAELSLDNGTSLATVTISGPNDRWFAMQFGSFLTGMQAGSDLVYWNGTILVDARHNGIGSTPTNDATNNWTLVTNTNNLPAIGQRTLVYTRPFITGDANDFTFNFSDTEIDLALAKHQINDFVLAYHGGGNRDVLLDTAFSVLGLEDFSLKASTVFPNPSTGNFTISTKTFLDTINVYNINGAVVKTIKVEDTSENVEFNISGLPVGVYFLELKNDTEKTWKKVIIE
jgi:hypothetical protein